MATRKRSWKSLHDIDEQLDRLIVLYNQMSPEQRKAGKARINNARKMARHYKETIRSTDDFKEQYDEKKKEYRKRGFSRRGENGEYASAEDAMYDAKFSYSSRAYGNG